MGLFNAKKEGGIMDMIRCDEKDFLIWKWRPNASAEVGASHKENSIRWGSGLRVRPGQAAVFLYQNQGGYDVITGPFDDVLKTDNLPVLAGLVGLAYKGGTPFQAEVYFINLARGMELPFIIPFFRVIPAEPEYKVYNVEVAVKGAMAYQIPSAPESIKYFLESWGTSDTTRDELEAKVKTLLTQEIKQIVANVPKDTGIFIMHLNSLIGEIGHYILARLQERLMQRFGIFASDVILSDIRYDEESEAFQRLKRITEDQAHLFNLENEKTALLSYQIQRETMRTDADVRNQQVRETARINMENMGDMAARQREEAQFAQHLQAQEAARQARLASEAAYINAHSIDVQGEVLKSGMANLGSMGTMSMGGDGKMNPAGMMTGMMMGAAVGGQVGNMMDKMGQTMGSGMASAGQPGAVPPPIPQAPAPVFFLVMDGAQNGPFDAAAIGQLVAAGTVNAQTLGWTAGMTSWQPISTIPALAGIFNAAPAGGQTPPPIPPTV